MVDLINRIGATEQIPLEARCADLATNELDKIHNKGVIVDDRKVLVSSINWNSNSPNFNREAGVIIDHPGVARYFREVFDDDWAPAIKTPPVQTDYLKIVIVIGVLHSAHCSCTTAAMSGDQAKMSGIHSAQAKDR